MGGKVRQFAISGPLQDSQFRWFFLGRFVSLLGTNMAPVALAFAVLRSSHSTSGDLGVVLAARTVPMLAFLLVGGVLADRGSRKTVLMVSNLGAALTQATVAAVVLTGSYRLVAVVVLQLLNGIFAGFSQPALRGVVPYLVDSERRQRANSLLGSARNVTSILGPSIAGVMVVTIGAGWAIAADAVSYLAGAFCLSRIVLPVRKKGSSSSFFRDFREGWLAFRALKWVRIIVIAFAISNGIYVGVWNVLGPTIAAASIGAASWGAVLSASAVGLLAASVAMYRSTAIRSLTMGLPCYALGALPMIILGLGGNLYLLISAAFLSGMGQGAMAIVWETSLQNRVAPNLLSRIAAFDNLGSYIAIPVGQVSVGPIMSAFGGSHVVVGSGILFGAVVITPILFKAVREPAPEPGAETGAHIGGSQSIGAQTR